MGPERLRTALRPDLDTPLERIHERRVVACDHVAERSTAREIDVEIGWVGRKALDGTADLAPVDRDVAGDHLDASAARKFDDRDLVRRDVAVLGRLHLLLPRQVDPQLEAAHAAAILLGHLRVDDAAPGRHPLHAAAGELAAVAEVVLVAHVAVEHVGHGLEATVRMRRETGDVVGRVVGRELVEHEKGIEIESALATEAPAKLHAGAVGGGDALDRALQFAIRHCSGSPLHATSRDVSVSCSIAPAAASYAAVRDASPIASP